MREVTPLIDVMRIKVKVDLLCGGQVAEISRVAGRQQVKEVNLA